MASKTASQSDIKKVRLPVKKRTSIGSGMPLNKQKRRNWKAYRGQGRG